MSLIQLRQYPTLGTVLQGLPAVSRPYGSPIRSLFLGFATANSQVTVQVTKWDSVWSFETVLR